MILIENSKLLIAILTCKTSFISILSFLIKKNKNQILLDLLGHLSPLKVTQTTTMVISTLTEISGTHLHLVHSNLLKTLDMNLQNLPKTILLSYLVVTKMVIAIEQVLRALKSQHCHHSIPFKLLMTKITTKDIILLLRNNSHQILDHLIRSRAWIPETILNLILGWPNPLLLDH